MNKPIRLLHLEDNPRDADLVAHALKAENPTCDIVLATGKKRFESAVSEESFDLILCDFNVPDYDGLEAIRFAHNSQPETPVIVISGAIGDEGAVECLRIGATDYVLKGNLGRLSFTITRALAEAEELRKRKARERQFFGLFEYSSDAILVLVQGGTVKFANHTARELFGDRVSEGQEFDLQHGDVQNQELSLWCCDGSVAFVDMHTTQTTLFDEPAQIVTLQRITERKRAEEAIQQVSQESAQDTTFSKMIEAALVLGAGAFTFAMTYLFDLSRHAFSWLQAHSDTIVDDVLIVAFVIAVGAILFAIRRWKKCRQAIASLSRVQDALQTLHGELDVRVQQRTAELARANDALKDEITQRMHAEEALHQLNAQLERRIEERTTELSAANERLTEASLAKSRFLACMSHELRTPLNGILGFADVLRRGLGSEEQMAAHLETIHVSGRHLQTLIDDILDLSKVEAGKMEFELVQCSPHEIISDVLSVLRVRAREKSLTLEARWLSSVPETIRTDPVRLRQLLINVVGNAIKFTKQGGVTLTASVSIESPDPRFQIEVRDTGIGIARDQLQDIFDPFTQANSSITRRFGGTGLGMTISRSIARELGGDIEVESELGRGSLFRITLNTGPFDDVHILEIPPSEVVIRHTESPPPSAIQMHGARVLLVDDGETNRDLIELVLGEAGAEIVSVEDGRQGIEATTRQQFDLILMDIQMPVMDGYTATRELRRRGSTLPIIALTANAMRGDREKCLEAGCNGYLAKPIDVDNLLQTVANALTDAGAQREVDMTQWQSSAKQILAERMPQVPTVAGPSRSAR